ncbi:RHS repeat-associated core domain-containing protein [Streptomyces sp. NPDC049906]|uniref:RHS repeat domain-containing protein n=1 Tax=Streptomyces sp. NPDC049906 TaxID=3155656 RepID=UPI0034465362
MTHADLPASSRIPAALRRASLVLSAVMVGTLLQGAVAPVVMAAGGLPDLPQAEKPVAGSSVNETEPRPRSDEPRVPTDPPEAAWPKAATATISLPASLDDRTRLKGAPGLPITIAAADKKPGTSPDRVRTQLHDRARAARAGTDGILISLEAQRTDAAKARSGFPEPDSRLRVSVDYGAFAQAYGGGYASRMRLVQLPACALTTPNEDACRTVTPVEADNDTVRQTLTAPSVRATASEPTVLAATAAAAGDKGDYQATSLSPSAAWNTNLNTGDFTWSYDLPTPSVPGDLVPDLGLSYSSASIDGRTSSTNNQSSWVGDGFDLAPGSIERRYKPCAEDGEERADGSKPGDLCWAYDNAVLSFNGKGGELVPVGSDQDNDPATTEFKLKKDDGTRILRMESTARANGDNDGEYWRLTTPDGTRYYFGYNRLPGWTEGKETTDSTWTVPVYGNNAGEECHKTTGFADSWCQQAWRWNLDYVVDPHGNAMAYHYTKETNSYGRNLKAADDTPYTRGGHLKRIDYGLKSSRVFADKALAQVVFTNAERCLPQEGVTCAPDTIDTKASYWYDTPWDLNCKTATNCDNGRLSPSFWSRKRLTDVTTQVLKADGTYGKVDSWKLNHRWGMADTDYQLLLDSVQRTGHTATPAVTLPKTTFTYASLENRLDKTGDGYAPFIKARLSTVADESGGQTDVNYSPPACAWSSLPTPETNTTRCFPQYFGGNATDDPDVHWFNKYVVTSVTATDRTGGAPDQVTRYDYLGGAAWHFDDDDGLTKEKHKTWSQWRGYGHVRVRTGGQGADGMKSQRDSYFLRGMHGDRQSRTGGTKTVTVTLGAGEGDPLTDHESLAGFGYKTVDYDEPNGKVLAKTVSRPWHHETAKKVRSWGTVTADLTGTSHTKSWTSTDDGAGAQWRTTATAMTMDTVAGRVTRIDDFGDTTTPNDDQCTRTTYADNTAANILHLASRAETVATSCDGTVDRTEDVIADIRTAYDGGAYGAAPTKGDVTANAVLKSHNGTTGTYLESGATFDGYGRQLTSTDLTADVTATNTGTPVRAVRTDGRTTTTAFTPATGIPLKTVSTTPPAKASDATTAQTTTTDLHPLRGLAVKETDTNNNVTETAHDALGRTSKIWLADRRNTQTPNHEYTYTVAENRPVAVTSRTLDNNGGQIASHVIYDGFLRERQTQAPGPDNGTVLTDTFHDERGLVTKTFAPYYATTAPSTTLFQPENALSVETQTRTIHDGLGREVETREIAGNGDGGPVLKTTRSLHGGDRTTVIAPEGGTTTTTLTDARGRTTELRQHHERTGTGAYDSTTYEYAPRGQLSKVTGPDDSAWTYTHDQLGRQTSTTDPDKGTSTSTYDDRGQLTFTKGSRTDVPGLAHLYDGLGRRTETREGTPTGTLRAKWTYDTLSGAKGHLTESTRYVGTHAYTSKVTAYDRLYRPIRTAVVIPAVEGKLQGTYQSGATFKPSGLPASVNYSAAGSLAGGSVNYDYAEDTLRPTTVYGQGVTGTTAYSLTGKPLQYTMSLTDSPKKTQVTNTYEWGTQRLATSRVDRQDQPGVDRNVTYAYDEAGNVLSQSDVSRTGTDTQCAAYDHLGRLTKAWTQSTTTCAATPTAPTVGGPAPYWNSYTYDESGNRKTEVQHHTGGDTSQNTTRTYTYPGAGQPLAHSLSSVTTTDQTGTRTDNYSHDTSGNMTARPGQTLEWDAEGRLSKVVEGSRTTQYLYDADGNRLLARNTTGTTLYLGHTEVTLPNGATKATALRYFDLGGGHQAVRSDDGTFTFTIADHHNTGQLAVNATDLTLTQRRTLPFGGPRGTTPTTWPGSKGFIGGTDDTQHTGLAHLNAREYDPTLGRFISVDPLLDTNDPQQMNGYTYANNNPHTLSDPTGLRPEGACGGFGPCKVGEDKNKNPKWETWQKSDTGWTWGYSSNKTTTWTSGKTKYTATTWTSYNQRTGHGSKTYIQSQAIKQTQKKNPMKSIASKASKAFKTVASATDSAWESAKDSSAAQWVGNNWEDIKLYSTFVGFGVCVAATVGTCMGAGAVIAGGKFMGDGIGTGSWSVNSLSKDLAWTAVGGGSAATFGRLAGGARNWREAYWTPPKVSIPQIYRTKVPGVRGVGGGRKSYVTVADRKGPIDWGSTYGNYSVNAGFNTAFCGAGEASLGAYGGVC